MKIYLIRHGRQCSRLCNVDVDLSEEGYRQASLLGERLFREKIQAVYSSSLLRAVETAQAANLYWNVEHFIRPELEEISFGDMEGMSDEEIAAAYKDFKAQQGRMEEDLPYPGGECAADVVRRAEPVFMEMVHSGYDRIAVVTHGGVIMSMLAQRGMPRRAPELWMADSGCGYLLQCGPELWMRDGIVEVSDIIPFGYLDGEEGK